MFPYHVQTELKKSAIPTDKQRAYFSYLTAEDLGNLLGWAPDSCGWVSNPDRGYSQVKLDKPRKGVKYESLPADKPGFSVVENTPTPSHVIITEGYKKAVSLLCNDPLASEGLRVVSLHGVTRWNTPGTTNIKPELLEELNGVGTVKLAFDLDSATNKEVYRQLSRLGAALEAEGRVVEIGAWNRSYKGIDDFYYASLYNEVDPLQWLPLSSLAESRASAISDNDKGSVGVFAGLGYLPDFPRVVKGDLTDHLHAAFNAVYPYQHVHEGILWAYSSGDWYPAHKLLTPFIAQAVRLLVKKKDGEELPLTVTARQITDAESIISKRQLIEPSYNRRVSIQIPSVHYLVFTNGVYYCEDNLFVPNSDLKAPPFFTAKIPYDLRPNGAIPDLFRAYLESSYGASVIEVIRAMLATILNPMAPYDYAFCLKGASGSGKSTLLEVIAGLWGSDLAGGEESSLSGISDMDKRYQCLRGRRAYIVGDVQRQLSNIGEFCDLVTNGYTTYRRLRSSEIIRERAYCRFILASTEPIRVENSSAGWNRRLKIISTLPRVQKLSVDHLSSALAECLPNIAGWALSMSPGDRDRVLREYTSDDASSDQRAINDPIAQFIEEALMADSDQHRTRENTHPLSSVYRIVERWYLVNKIPYTVSYPRFKQRVASLLPNNFVKAGVIRIEGKSVRVKDSLTGVKGINEAIQLALMSDAMVSSLTLESFDHGGLASLGVV